MVGAVDKAFQILNWLIIGISLVGMVTMTLTGLDSRTREMTILRSLGASPYTLASLVLVETLVIGILAVTSAIGLVRLLTWAAADFLSDWTGIRTELTWLAPAEFFILIIVVLAGLVTSLIPAAMVYKRSIHRGFLN